MLTLMLPITAVQRMRQRQTLFVEPLLASGALQHLHEPLAVAAAIAVDLGRVMCVRPVPRQTLELQINHNKHF